MSDDDDLERSLTMAQIDNLKADTALKLTQAQWEPWKALSAAFGAGVAVASGLIALAAWIISHWH